MAEARAVSLPLSCNGQITSGDQDWDRVTTPAMGRLNAGLSGLSADLQLSIDDAAGNLLHSSTAGGTSSESVGHQGGAGTYCILVAPSRGAVSGYALNVSQTPAA